MRPLLLRLAAVICLLSIIAAATAQPVPTYAWRRVTANPTDDDLGNVVIDASGNAIYEYTEITQPLYTIHLVKVSPANNVIFDSTIQPGNGGFGDLVTLSPVISGRQFAWVIGRLPDSSTLYSRPYFACFDLSAPSAPIIDGVVPAPYGNSNVCAAHSDASGNLMLAIDQVGANGLHELHMDTIDQSGMFVSATRNGSIWGVSGYWDGPAARWIISGYIPSDAHPTYSGFWGVFDPVTGAIGPFEGWPSQVIAGVKTESFHFILNPLPGDLIGVTLNDIDHEVGKPTTYEHIHELRDTYNNIQGVFHWYAGYGGQLAAFSSTGTLYSVGTYSDGTNFVDEYGWNGALLNRLTHQPVTTIYPTQEGFFGQELYTPSNNIFLEHYIAATNTYDWGRSYVGTASGFPIPGNVAMFQNSLYVLNMVKNTGTGYDLVMERFVTGITLSSVACATSVKGGTQLAATIYLNGAVTGSPMTVALNSSSNSLLLPNGLRGQNFQVPVGQDHLTVNLNAQTVTTNTPVLLTAIQFGVRRTAVTTVTP